MIFLRKEYLMSLVHLPKNIFQYIMRFMGRNDFLRMLRTSRAMHDKLSNTFPYRVIRDIYMSEVEDFTAELISWPAAAYEWIKDLIIPQKFYRYIIHAPWPPSVIMNYMIPRYHNYIKRITKHGSLLLNRELIDIKNISEIAISNITSYLIKYDRMDTFRKLINANPLRSRKFVLEGTYDLIKYRVDDFKLSYMDHEYYFHVPPPHLSLASEAAMEKFRFIDTPRTRRFVAKYFTVEQYIKVNRREDGMFTKEIESMIIYAAMNDNLPLLEYLIIRMLRRRNRNHRPPSIYLGLKWIGRDAYGVFKKYNLVRFALPFLDLLDLKRWER